MTLAKENIQNMYTLSPMQEGMYFWSQYDPSSSAYFEQAAYRLSGNLDIGCVQRALNELFRRHDVLRTVFVRKALHRLLQVVQKEREAEFYFEDISSAPDKEGVLKDYRERDRQRGFDLNRDVLMRVAVLKLADAEYEFIWSHHHILMDGWCVGILIGEFFEIYTALLENRQYRLPPVLQYRVYIDWLEKQDKEKSRQYWADYLEGYEQAAVVPRLGTVGRGERGYRLEHLIFSLTGQETARLQSLAASLQATLNHLVQAVWGIVLARYNRRQDVVFGAVVSGRPPEIAGVESMVGLFINTVPVRLRFGDKTTFKELVSSVRQQAADGEPYHYCSLADIQADSPLKQNLLDHIITFQNFPLTRQIEARVGGSGQPGPGEAKAAALAVSKVENYEQTNYDFGILVTPGEQLKVKLDYNSLVYDHSWIERVGRHFKMALRRVADSHGELCVEELSLLTDGDKHQLLVEFNDTRQEFPRLQTIVDLFTDQVVRIPAHVAVAAPSAGAVGPKQLTYSDLDERAARLARQLQTEGAGADTIVAVMMERSLAMIVSIFAVLKAGAAYLPIDPAYPQDRRRYILKESGSRILLTPEKIECSPPRACLRPPLASTACMSYVIYTSGTTGRPKGVMIDHYSLVNRLYWMQQNYPLTEDDAILQKTSFTFDVSVWELLWWAMVGARLCLLVPGGEREPAEIVAAVSRCRVTVMHFVPSMLSMFLNFLSERDERKSLACLKQVFCSGETLTVSQVDRFKELLFKENGTQLANLYGPTEATIDVSYYNCLGQDSRGVVPIGRPIDNIELYVLDRNMELLPPGISGELWIAGVGLARGYLNRPELTAEKFVNLAAKTREETRSCPNKTPTPKSQILYRTGDLARFLPDGNIEFLGRLDQQVKIRGFRIELGEIENHLLRHPRIKEAVVVDRQGHDGDKYLCAYIVPLSPNQTSPTNGTNRTNLRQYLAEFLPSYMIPASFVELEEIPLTANGKVDRRALPEPEWQSGRRYAAPRTQLELQLVELWAQILGLERGRIGIDDPFFALGGHSLKATLLLARLHRDLEVKVPMVDFFKAPTVRGLARIVEAAQKEGYAPVNPTEKKEYYPLSSAQRRLYIIRQMETGGTLYNMPGGMVLSAAAGAEAGKLAQTFKRLMARHESLRTFFVTVGDEPVQVIHETVDFKIEYYGSPAEPLAPAQNPIQDFIRPFDLSTPPLLRVGIIYTPPPDDPFGEARCMLMVDVHHIVSDGISQQILSDEFLKLWRGEALRPLRIQYKDYACWQTGRQVRQEIKSQEAFWRQAFSPDQPVLNLPCDYTRPKELSFAGSSCGFWLTEAETAGLNRLALEHGTTLFMVLLSIFNILLSRLSGQEDIVVGVPVSGRRHADVEQVIGMFVNTLALRNRPLSGKRWPEFLLEVKEKTLLAFENQEYQFEDLVESVVVERDVSRHPLFEVMFALQNLGERPRAGAGVVDGAAAEYEGQVSRFDMSWICVEREQQLWVEIEYCTKLFKAGTIERFAGYFKNIAAAVTAAPDIRLAGIEILAESERQQILYAFNDTLRDYPRERTIPDLWAQQVDRGPDRTAVMGPLRLPSAAASPLFFGQVSYGELERRSSHLTALLRAKGVTADTVVGLMAARSVSMIIGILAILQAGGAYLPIEPGNPAERIAYMLADSGAECLVTDGADAAAALESAPQLDLIAINEMKRSPQNDGHPKEGLPQTHLRAVNLAYVIYTSGTTGRPKGVLTTHTNVVRVVKGTNYIEIKARDRLLQLSNYAFDGSVFDIYGALLNGAALVLVGEEEARAVDRLAALIRQEQVTVFFVTSALFNTLVDLQIDCLAKVRHVLIGGDRVSVAQARRAREYSGKDRLINVYGPTETTVFATYYPIADIEPEAATIPIGRPLANTSLYILDKNLNPVGLGISGEVYIGGEGNARGYLNHPELTADKFVNLAAKLREGTQSANIPLFQHSIIPEFKRSGSLYRTGDLARFLPDGNIEFLGRIDHQVKIRGFRIELGEIESKLSNHREIQEAVVIDRTDNGGTKYLCAYFVAGRELAWSELREYLQAKLPDYMIPAFFVQLASLPLTANGKVDRRALPSPEGISLGMDKDKRYTAPRSEVEEQLAETWEKVLGRSPIGIDENFFALGGDSIKAIQIAARLNAAGYKMEMRDIFVNQSIAQLAPGVKKTQRGIDQSVVTGRVPLTPIQREFFASFSLERHHFNQSMMLFAEEGFAEETAAAVFEKLQEHHDALRMSYRSEDGEMVQLNNGLEHPQSLQVFDLRLPPDADREMSARVTAIQTGIDLGKGPLLKAGLFHLEDGDRLFIVVHHLVIDGVSWRILLEDMDTLFGQYRRGQPFQLPLKTDSFKVWSEGLAAYANSQPLLGEKEYWSRVESTEVQEIQGDFESADNLVREAVDMSFALSQADTERLLTGVNEAFGTEINDILLAALGRSICELYQLKRVPVALEGHGRQEVLEGIDVSRTVGWFTSWYPVILDFSYGGDMSRQLKEVKESLRRVPNRGIGYGILKWLTAEEHRRDIKFRLKPQIGFNYLGQFDTDAAAETFRLSRESRGSDISPQARRGFELDVSGIISGNCLRLTIVYNKRQYRQQTVERLLDRYRQHLKDIILYCSDRQERELTPADLTYNRMSIEDLESINALFDK